MNIPRRKHLTLPVDPASRWQSFWLPSVHGVRAVLEVLIGMAVIVALCGWLYPEDPLLLQTGFPWLGLFALIFALRYGALLGVFAGGCLLLAWWLLYGEPDTFPKSYYVGLFALLVLAGHFSDLWAGRLLHEAGGRRYLSERLASLTNGYYLLRVSHDRLEKELLSRPTTVRDSIARLRDSIQSGDEGIALPQAQPLMDYLANICHLNEAAIFAVRGRDEVLTQAVAFVGNRFLLESDDPLVMRCLETGRLAHVREITKGEGSAYLVCAPIRSVDGRVLGLLAIRRMRFMAFNHDSLQLILVILTYYADSVLQRPAIEAVRRQVPDCPEDLALELSRLSHLHAVGGPGSYLVALTFQEGGVQQAALEQLKRQCRVLDPFWELEMPNVRVLLVLLSLTGREGVDGYLARVEDLLQAQFGLGFQQARVGVYSQALGARDPGTVLRAFMATWSQS